MVKKYGVLYCSWQDDNVIKFSEVIEARSLKEALKKTDRNLELNVVIPLNKTNKRFIRELLESEV